MTCGDDVIRNLLCTSDASIRHGVLRPLFAIVYRDEPSRLVVSDCDPMLRLLVFVSIERIRRE